MQAVRLQRQEQQGQLKEDDNWFWQRLKS
jgi:hypothetical protein